MTSDVIDFYKIIIDLDNYYEDNEIPVEPYNMYEELVSKYGENNRDRIKETIEEYYQIFLDWYEDNK